MPRCPTCGANNSTGARFCSMCGKSFPQTSQQPPPSRTPQPHQRTQGASPFTSNAAPNRPFTGQAQPPQPVSPQQHHGSSTPSPQVQPQTNPVMGTTPFSGLGSGIQRLLGGAIFHPNPQLEGTVISVDAPYDEPPDFDLAKITLGCLFLLPFVPFLIALAIFLGLFRINVLNVLGILNLLGLSRAPQAKREPVRNFRVRDASGNEHQVKMKGHLKTGNVSPGDTLSIWGRWKHGTLIFVRAFNHRTSSHIRLRKINWARLLGMLIVLGILLAILASLSQG